MKRIFILFALLVLSLSALGGCGGGGAGSTSIPAGESPGVAYSVQLTPSHFTAQTNSSIILRARVLDGNGMPVVNIPVTFTNLSEPFGVIKSVLQFIGISKPKTTLSAAKVVNTDASGIATISFSSTVAGFATIQAEINNGVGIVRDKKLVTFSDTFNLPIFSAIPQLFLDVDTNASFSSPDEPSDFILFKTTSDNQRYIRATVLFDTSINGKIITFGSDSTDVTFDNGANEIVKTADANGQATVLATVNPSALSQTSRVINITAVAADGAFSAIPLFLEPVTIAPAPSSSLTAFPTTVPVDKTSTITATVKTSTGSFAPDGTVVNLTATCGTVDPAPQTTGGVATATFKAPATVPSGGVCTVTGKTAGVTIGSANITIVSGLAVQLNPSTISGVSGGTVTGTISGGIPPYSVTSNDLNLPVPSLSGSTFTQTVPAGTSVRTVTFTVTDSLANVAATPLTITGPTSLQILPFTVTVVSKTTPQTVSFDISGGTPPYIVTSSDPRNAFNDNGAGAHAGNGVLDADEGGIWKSSTAFSTITATFPASVPSGTVELLVVDSLGVTNFAIITIVGGGGVGGLSDLTVAPSNVAVTGTSDTSDNVSFVISGGISPYSVFSDNTLVVPNPTVIAPTPPDTLFRFVVNPAPVLLSEVVGLNVVDSIGAVARASIVVTPNTTSMTLNPSAVEVTVGTVITFSILGGTPDFTVYSSNTGQLSLSSNPLSVTGGVRTFTATALASGIPIITVVDSNGGTTTANVIINNATAPPVTPPVALSVSPSTITLTGLTGTTCPATDCVDFVISGGQSPYTMFSSNTAVIPNVAVSGSTFTINPDAVVTDTPVTLTVKDNLGATATATVTVKPALSGLGLNPTSIEVTVGTDIPFAIIGGKPNFNVFSSNTGILTVGGNPLNTAGPTFTAHAVTAGTATVTVVDSDGKTVTAAVKINAVATPPTPDFAVGCTPNALNVPATGSNTTSCSVTSLNGFNAAVALSCTGLPAGMTCSNFNPVSPLTPPANLTTSTVLTITDAAVPAGTYSFFLLGQNGSLSHTASITVTVP